MLVADQRYRFSVKKDASFSAEGLEVQSTIKRYEGKGRDQKLVGEYGVDLKLNCPWMGLEFQGGLTACPLALLSKSSPSSH